MITQPSAGNEIPPLVCLLLIPQSSLLTVHLKNVLATVLDSQGKAWGPGVGTDLERRGLKQADTLSPGQVSFPVSPAPNTAVSLLLGVAQVLMVIFINRSGVTIRLTGVNILKEELS